MKAVTNTMSQHLVRRNGDCNVIAVLLATHGERKRIACLQVPLMQEQALTDLQHGALLPERQRSEQVTSKH